MIIPLCSIISTILTMSKSSQKKRSRIILAIDPGTREMGVAVLEGTQLLYAGVKTFPPKIPYPEGRQRIRAVLSRLLSDFNPDLVAVEKTLFANNPSSRLLNEIEGQIRMLAKRWGITMIVVAASTVKKVMGGYGTASKYMVAKAVVSYYPTLRIFLNQNKKWKRRYHANMFDAVALGMVVRDGVVHTERAIENGKGGK